MERRNWYQILSIGCALILGLNIWAGTISGIVTDETGVGIEGVGVRAIHEEGMIFTTETDADGGFSLNRLPEGVYYTDLTDDYNRIIKPECGFYFDFLGAGGSIYYVFEVLRPTGVSIDFGSPIGSKTRRPGKDISRFPEHGLSFQVTQPLPISPNGEVDLVFSANNLAFLSAPSNRIVIRGAWYSRGVGPLDIQIMSGHEEYQVGMKFMTTNNWDFRNMMIIDLCRDYFDQDGDIARFKFSVSQAAEGLIGTNSGDLCFCVEEVTFYQENSPLFGTSYLWCGQLTVGGTGGGASTK